MRRVTHFPADSALTILSSVWMEEVLSGLSRAIVGAIDSPSRSYHRHLAPVLRGLTNWTTRPRHLAAMAYEWCSVICAKYRDLDEGDILLLLSLEVGFRNLDPVQKLEGVDLDHTRHHQLMVDIVFGSQRDEVIGDFLHAWTSRGSHHKPHTSLTMCARHLVDLPNLLFASLRLRRLVIRSIGLIGHQEFEKVGTENFVGLLNCLGVGVGEVDSQFEWMRLLMDIIKSPVARDRLSFSYWELLLDLLYPRDGEYVPIPGLHSRVLEDGMELLFRQRPDHVQRFEGWAEERFPGCIPPALHQIREYGRLVAGQRSTSR